MVDAQTRETSTDESGGKTARAWLPYIILAAAAVIVAVALFGGTEEGSEVDSPADVDAPAPTEPVVPEPDQTSNGSPESIDGPTITTPTVPLPPVLEGSRVPHDELIFGNGQMGSVAASEIGVVAVGASRSAEGSAVVWVSPEGFNWTRLSQDDSVFGDGWLGSVARYGRGFIAVGSDDSDAAVWMSPDGVDWERAPRENSSLGGDGDQMMISVVEFDGGLVAVGESISATGQSAAVWISPDGITWSRVRPDESIFEDSVTVDVARFGEGLVAVGFDVSGGDADGVVWISSDGVDWERAPREESILGGDGDQIMVSVAASNGRLVAVGFDQPGLGDAAVWTSEDALTWTRVPHDESIFGAEEGGGSEMTSVEALDEGFVAAGFQQLEGDMNAVVWTTSDGLTWARVSTDELVFGGDEDQRIASVAVVNGNVVAVGLQAPSGQNLDIDPDAAVWTLAS